MKPKSKITEQDCINARVLSRLIVLLALAAVAIAALWIFRTDPVKAAIDRQLLDYPESHVQDMYKSFCQDKLGPGHLIPDKESARRYLDSELRAYRKDLDSCLYAVPSRRYYPTGDKGNYIRVDLSVVLEGLVGEEAFLDAFVRSANEGERLSEDQWVAEWKDVEKVLRRSFMNIPDAGSDLETISGYLSEGKLIMHHSDAFNAAYHPHYRIIAKDIFEKELKALVER